VLNESDVDAGAVATRILDGLAPLIGGAVTRFAPEDPGAFAARLVVLIQPQPSGLLRLVLEAEPPATAVELLRGRTETLDNGDAIEEAVADFMAAILSAMGGPAAEKLIKRAARAHAHGGGLLIAVEPLSGVVKFGLVEPGQTLDQMLMIGGIAPDRPETRH